MIGSNTLKNIDDRQTLKNPKLDQLDSILNKWFAVIRSEGKPITGLKLIEKAKQFNADLILEKLFANFLKAC